ncbi:MAG: histidinol-phosphatase [Verrucomicrobiota bacterium]
MGDRQKTKILYETHSHTTLCKHAEGKISEYASHAEARGLKGLTVTCHCPLPDGMSPHVRMAEDQYTHYHEMIHEAREQWRGRVDILAGLESDYFPGLNAYLEKLHARAPLNYVLGSVHPQIIYYRARFSSGTWENTVANYFDQLAETAESGLFDCVSHPDLIKNESPHQWNIQKAMPFIKNALDRIAKTGVAMELNTSGINKAIQQMNPAPEILDEMNTRGIPVVIGADAHVPTRVADLYEAALNLLEDCGYKEVSFFIERKRQTVSIEQARLSLIPTKEVVAFNN